MELSEIAYKESQLGVIPDDWKELTFKEICWVNQGLQIPISQRLKFPISNSKIYITIQYLNDGKTTEYISDYSSSVCCSKEDVLMTRTGNTGIVITDVEGVFHNNFFKINFSREIVVKDYLVYYLNMPNTQKIILSKAGISTIPDLNHSDFYSIPIVLPPTLAEQEVIAEALSDADAMISSLEKLLAKKKLIKQGLMQKLLTPKEGWVKKKLGEIGKTYGGLSGKTKSDFGTGNSTYIPFMNIMSNPIIDINYLEIVNVKSNEYQNIALKADLFFNGSSETPEEVGMCSVLMEDIPNLYLNSFCFGFRINSEKEYNGLFLSYLFRSPFGRNLFYSSAQGATRYNLSKSNFLKLEIDLPNYKDQTEIAQILFDIDDELKSLERKKHKYQEIKQGMMQVLLTGKVRII
jgi:type I restriction enzyme S subunit